MEYEISCSDGTTHTRRAPSSNAILCYVQGIASRPRDIDNKTWEIREIPTLTTGIKELLYVVTRKDRIIYTRVVNE